MIFMFALKKAFAPVSRFLSAAIDCEVRQWGPWSPCSSVCGAGTTERSRQVATPPHNGGTPCPDLKQRRGCLAHTETCSAAKGNIHTTVALLNLAVYTS